MISFYYPIELAARQCKWIHKEFPPSSPQFRLEAFHNFSSLLIFWPTNLTLVNLVSNHGWQLLPSKSQSRQFMLTTSCVHKLETDAVYNKKYIIVTFLFIYFLAHTYTQTLHSPL